MKATPLFHMCIYVQNPTIYSLHRATPIDRLMLQAPGVLPLQYVSSAWDAVVQSTCITPVQSHSHLFEARPGASAACKLAGSYIATVLYKTPTILLLYLLFIVGIHKHAPAICY